MVLPACLLCCLSAQQPATPACLLECIAAGNPGLPITTGDALQAACGLLVHAALGRPLLPVKPHAMAVIVQQPTPPGFFGNAAHMLRVNVPPGSEQPAAGDHAGALQRLAGAIRGATAAFHSQPVSHQCVASSWACRMALMVLPAHRCVPCSPLAVTPQEAALRELRDTEELVGAPAHHMLSFLAKARLPYLTASINYVPTQQVGVGRGGVEL